jgi:hypothetical protein
LPAICGEKCLRRISKNCMRLVSIRTRGNNVDVKSYLRSSNMTRSNDWGQKRTQERWKNAISIHRLTPPKDLVKTKTPEIFTIFWVTNRDF